MIGAATGGRAPWRSSPLAVPRGVRALAFVLLASGLAGCGPAPDPRAERVDRIFEEYDRTDAPGCAAGVVEHGTLVLGRGYGMASLELSVPNTPRTVYYVGSVSKQFVAASVVIAARQGHLDLDDDIRGHLPEMPDYGRPITVRQLIHHTSGLRDYLALMWMAGMPYENVYADEEIVALLARQEELNFAPGDEHLYSNSGYFLLAEIVERVTGRSLRDFAEENIFGPLGMTHTHFHDDRRMVVPGRAMAYEAGEEGFRLEWYLNFDKVGSGGLLTTVEDLARWDRSFYDDSLAGGGLWEQLLERGVLNDGKVLDYAFALQHGEHRGLKTIDHAGAFMGFRAQLLRFPDERLSVVVLCNRGDANPDRLAREVAEVYLRDRLPHSDDDLAEGGGPVFVELPPEVLAGWSGGYRSRKDQSILEVSHESGQLVVKGGPRPLRLSPLSPTRFAAVGTPSSVELEFGGDEAALLLFVDGNREAAYDAVELVVPTPEVLETYAGRYFSDELQTTYALSVDDGALTLQRGRFPAVSLEPTAEDEFQTEGLRVTFGPRSRGRATGLTAHAGRVRNIRFERAND